MKSARAFKGALDGTVGGSLDPRHNPVGESEGVEPEDSENDEQQEQEQEEIIKPVESRELEEAIFKAVQDAVALKDQRAGINHNVTALGESLQARGIPKAVFKLIQKLHTLDESQLEVFDLALRIARKAIGKPMQMEMFKPTLVK